VGRSLLIRDRESVLCLKFVFGLLFWALSVDRRSQGCESCMIFRSSALRIMAQLGCWGFGSFYFEGVSLEVSSDDGRWWIPCLQGLFF